MSAPILNLHRKLAEIYAIVERIPKNGTAPQEMGGYPFVQVGDAADPIRKALSERHLTMLPSAIEIVAQSEHETENRSGRTVITTTCDVRTTWTVTDGETGETATIVSMGSGQDRGDKYVPKALTNSMKYALLLGFLMPTGDDPELARTDERTRRPAPRPAPSPRGGGAAIKDGPWEGPVTFGKPPTDGHARQTPNGSVFGFVITEPIPGRDKGVRHEVVAEGDFAEALDFAFKTGKPETAMVWGRLEMVPWEKDGKAMPAYRRIHAERVMTPEWTLPATDAGSGVSVAPGAAPNDLDGLDW